MGVMNKMRDNTGVVLWILVIAFGVIFMLQDTNVFDVIGATGPAVGKVNGQSINVDDYNQVVNARLEEYSRRTGDGAPPQMVDAERDRVFNMMVENALREQEMARLGISVSDAELTDMVVGTNPHPVIKDFFGDGEGGVDQAVLRSFIDNPDAQEDWVRIENYLRDERRSEKLDKLIEATVRVSDTEARAEYKRRNSRADVQYVALRYAAVADSAIQVRDRDLRSYYDDNKDDFSRERSYAVRYVSVSKSPTEADSADIITELERVRPNFLTATDDSLFLAQNFSERPYTDAFFRRDELDDEIADSVFSDLTVGRVVGPVVSGNQLHLVKILDVDRADEVSFRARHILFRAAEGDEAARSEANAKALDAMRRIRSGESFSDVAAELSDDVASGQNGGELGWFGPGAMVEPFEKAVESARTGRVVGPVETQFGVHVIEVVDRADRSVRLADYALAIRSSVGTLSRIEKNLDDLRYFAEEEGDFEGEAGRRDLQVEEVQIEKGQQFIPGIGNSRTLLNFLETASVGDVSPVIELNERFIVGQVTGVIEEGHRPFDEVRAEIEPRVKLKKKQEVQIDRLRSACGAGATLQACASAVGSPVRTAASLSPANAVVSGIGREPAFVGTAFGLKQGETSGAVAGESSAFIISVTSLSEALDPTEAQLADVKEQLYTERLNRVRSRWMTALREQADITDNRRLFYQ